MLGTPPRHVLLIDGHPDVRMMLGLAIEEAGFEAHTAATVADGLRMLSDDPELVAVMLDGDLDVELRAVAMLRDTWPKTAVVVMLDHPVFSTLPSGAVYLRKLTVAADVAGVLRGALGDVPVPSAK
jgi:DNA-binding NtrC family response regulator